MNPLELVELEEDFTAVARQNLVVDELHDFTMEPKSRIFSPDLGQFYIKGLVVKDSRTGKTLVRDVDFKAKYLSHKVFKKSGKDNAFIIEVTNLAVVSVLVTYQAVGGLYTSPTYLLKYLAEEYPEGLGPVIYWKNILYKPDQFKPANHRHHGLEIFGLNPLVASLEQVRGLMQATDRVKFKDFYDNTMTAYNALMLKIETTEKNQTDLINTARKGLEYQQGDFVYTDSNADQTALRRYGKWKRHLGVTLAAGGANTAGTSTTIGAGYAHPVRRTNLFQRIDDPWGNNGEIVEQQITMIADKVSFNEGDTVTITVQGFNIPAGQQIVGNFLNIPLNNLKNGNNQWSVVLDATGRGTFKLETVQNHATSGDIDVVVMPNSFPMAAISVKMIDISKTPAYRMFFSRDAQGVNIINRTNEGTVCYLNVEVTNPIQGEELDFNYSTGTATDADFVQALPKTMTVPGNGITRIRLEVKNDEIQEGDEILVPLLMAKGDKNILNYKARADLTIVDSSYAPEFNAYFSLDTAGTMPITSADEGTTCYIFARTTLPNGTKIKYQYGGTATTEDFDYRAAESIVSNGVSVARIAIKADNLTEGNEILGVTCTRENGQVLANLSLIINDTSLSPDGEIFFADSPTGSSHVNQFNEGDTMYIMILTKNLENGALVDIDYKMEGADTMAEINAEFNSPLPTRVPVTNNRAMIQATIRNDYTADGPRVFEAKLAMNQKTASCTIMDTSVPTYDFKFSGNPQGTGNITEVNEGGTCYYVIETKGVPAGTVFQLTYGGTASNQDFLDPRPTQAIMDGTGTIIIAYRVKEDYLSEGIENMIISARTGVTNRGSAEISIRDTSLTPQLNVLLSLSPTVQTAISSINEGVTAYVHMNWVNVPLNTKITWNIVHVTTTSGDFDKSVDQITTTVVAGTDKTTLTTVNDKTTEGNETFRIKAYFVLPDGRTIQTETGDITLVDTSKTEVFNFDYTSDAAGNNVITEVNEGGRFYIRLRTENIPNGETFTLTHVQVGAGYANDADFTPAISKTVLTVNNNFASAAFDVVADRSTEGDETLQLRCTRNSTNVSNEKSLIVRDTSRLMTGTLTLHLANGSQPLNNKFKEGEAGYALWTYQNGTNGDRVAAQIAVVDNADFSAHEWNVEKIIVAASGTVRWDFTIANDRKTEGDEEFRATVVNRTTNITYPTSATYWIQDTSRTTTYDKAGWYDAGGNATPTVGEGSGVFLQCIPVDGVAGDVYRMSITGGSATLNADYTVNTADKVYAAGGTIQWLFTIIEDRLTEGNETILATILNTTTGQTVGTYQLTIVDSSTTPQATPSWRNAPVAFGGTVITSVNEGSTAYLALLLTSQKWGDKWRISIAPNSGANAADINNFQTTILDVPSTNNSYVELPIQVTNDQLTEGDETLIMKIEFLPTGGSVWEDRGTTSILIVDTSKTPAFDIYYSNDAGGQSRITNANEGTTAFLIVKTVNVPAGTVLQVDFVGSEVDAQDFTSYFPPVQSEKQNITVQPNGIAYFQFDIKADNAEG